MKAVRPYAAGLVSDDHFPFLRELGYFVASGVELTATSVEIFVKVCVCGQLR